MFVPGAHFRDVAAHIDGARRDDGADADAATQLPPLIAAPTPDLSVNQRASEGAAGRDLLHWSREHDRQLGSELVG